MDREIKFRGKRVYTEDWVYGYYVKSTNDRAYIIRYATEDAINTNNEIDFLYHEVIPETVGQHIGRKDKNEKYIYKDDIIKRYNGEIGVVVFDEGCFILERVSEENCEYIQHCSEYFSECEIIGNVWDNKELLA